MEDETFRSGVAFRDLVHFKRPDDAAKVGYRDALLLKMPLYFARVYYNIYPVDNLIMLRFSVDIC